MFEFRPDAAEEVAESHGELFVLSDSGSQFGAKKQVAEGMRKVIGG
ncbi:MAG: hypothetical protein H0W81_01435 [Chloroflexi bacterium]|nr:hypothetical protein [Chloroflexota bacterium]